MNDPFLFAFFKSFIKNKYLIISFYILFFLFQILSLLFTYLSTYQTISHSYFHFH